MESTFDERMRVRRDECRLHGHSWDAFTPMGQQDPVRFTCSNCGRSLKAVPDEASVEQGGTDG